MTDSFRQLLQASELDASLRADAPERWQQVWSALEYQSVACDAAMLDYQHAYFRGAGWQIHDLSLVLQVDGKPCGLWPLSLGGPGDERRLTSAGAAIQAPVFVDGLSPRTVKKICTRLRQLIARLVDSDGCPLPLLEQAAQPGAGGLGMTEWHQQLIAAGATTLVRHDLYADLRPALADIRASFRKSFRPLINVGLRNWQVSVLAQAGIDVAVWNEFKQLHVTVAGRSTRSDETWARQFDMIAAGVAFLVALRDPADQRLVGAGFFQHSRDEGLYAVGAYDRSLFDKPLGHVVQQLAIETLKTQGVSWYRVGERHLAQDLPRPSDKELSIAAFKQGFASHMFCRYQFQLPASMPDESAEASE